MCKVLLKDLGAGVYEGKVNAFSGDRCFILIEVDNKLKEISLSIKKIIRAGADDIGVKIKLTVEKKGKSTKATVEAITPVDYTEEEELLDELSQETLDRIYKWW